MEPDLYTTWLDIPPGARPPDHYTLLGLPRPCGDLKRIEQAAYARLDKLDKFALHPDTQKRQACQEMMNQVAGARMALMDPATRRAYDRAQGLGHGAGQGEAAVSPAMEAVLRQVMPGRVPTSARPPVQYPLESPVRNRPVAARRRISPVAIVTVVLIVTAAVATALYVLTVSPRGPQATRPVAQASAPAAPAPSAHLATDAPGRPAPVAAPSPSALPPRPPLASAAKPPHTDPAPTIAHPLPVTPATPGTPATPSTPEIPAVPAAPPPAAVWVTLFRSADPHYWGLRADNSEAFALPLSAAPPNTRFVRLRRLDTQDSVILPLGAAQLSGLLALPPYAWVGAPSRWGPGTRGPGIISRDWKSTKRGEPVMAIEEGQCFTGWGFATPGWIDDRQVCVWEGKEIRATAFEISVTAGDLSAAERPLVAAPARGSGSAELAASPASAGPAAAAPVPGSAPGAVPGAGGGVDRYWTVIFRSDNPRYWGLHADNADAYAVPFAAAPAKTRYLRLRRMDTREAVILPVPADRVGTILDAGPYAWMGTPGEMGPGFRGPGILAHNWKSKRHGDPAISVESGQSVSGWGFATPGWVDDRQSYVWAGKEIGPTSFEIAVTAHELSAAERPVLLHVPR